MHPGLAAADRHHAAAIQARYVPRAAAREQHAAAMRERNAWLIRARELRRQQPRTANGQRFARREP